MNAKIDFTTMHREAISGDAYAHIITEAKRGYDTAQCDMNLYTGRYDPDAYSATRARQRASYVEARNLLSQHPAWPVVHALELARAQRKDRLEAEAQAKEASDNRAEAIQELAADPAKRNALHDFKDDLDAKMCDLSKLGFPALSAAISQLQNIIIASNDLLFHAENLAKREGL